MTLPGRFRFARDAGDCACGALFASRMVLRDGPRRFASLQAVHTSSPKRILAQAVDPMEVLRPEQ